MDGLFRSILGFYRYMRIWVFLRIGALVFFSVCDSWLLSREV